jgi:hypothetical protein
MVDVNCVFVKLKVNWLFANETLASLRFVEFPYECISFFRR